MLKIVGARCPECGGELEVQPVFDDDVADDHGELRCLGVDCKRPLAAGEVLADPEIEHIVLFDEDGFVIQHPLRERLDDGLFDCALLDDLRAMGRAPVDVPGRYRATPIGDGGKWRFEPVAI